METELVGENSLVAECHVQIKILHILHIFFNFKYLRNQCRYLQMVKSIFNLSWNSM